MAELWCVEGRDVPSLTWLGLENGRPVSPKAAQEAIHALWPVTAKHNRPRKRKRQCGSHHHPSYRAMVDSVIFRYGRYRYLSAARIAQIIRSEWSSAVPAATAVKRVWSELRQGEDDGRYMRDTANHPNSFRLSTYERRKLRRSSQK